MAGIPIKFTGAFRLAIDAKNRVNVPATFRDALRKRFPDEGFDFLYLAMAQWGEGIAVYPPKIYDGSTPGKTPLRKVSDEDEYTMHAQADSCQIDNAGRIRVPDALIKKAGLKKEIMFCGHGDFMQIWDPQKAEDVLAISSPSQGKNTDGGEAPGAGIE